MRPIAPLVVATLLFAACTGGQGHPVRTSFPRFAADEWPRPAPVGLPEPGFPDPDAALTQLFLGESELLRVLLVSRVAEPSQAREPVIKALPKMERAQIRRYAKGAPAGPVRNVSAFLITGWVPIAPAALADLIEDPAVERQILAATTFKPLRTQHRVPRHSRRSYWVEMLKVGHGPFRFDLKFGLYTERMQLDDGGIALRYDPLLKPRPQVVTMYRGATLLEPHAGGTRVTEVMIFGNSLSVPPPVWKALRPLVDTTLKNRAINLWKRAWTSRPIRRE